MKKSCPIEYIVLYIVKYNLDRKRLITLQELHLITKYVQRILAQKVKVMGQFGDARYLYFDQIGITENIGIITTQVDIDTCLDINLKKDIDHLLEKENILNIALAFQKKEKRKVILNNISMFLIFLIIILATVNYGLLIYFLGITIAIIIFNKYFIPIDSDQFLHK